jgi:putative membrane-bound dehydrogenase-like protein
VISDNNRNVTTNIQTQETNMLRSLFSLAAIAAVTISGGIVSAAKPVFQSKLITSTTPGHAVEVDAEIKGAKKLYLVVTDGGNGYGCDWADWAEPRLVGDSGEKKLTDLKWKSAGADWGHVQINKNAEGAPLRINGKAVEYGIGTHANSVIEYDLPEGFTRFKARAGLDNGGTDQQGGNAASVSFAVYTEKPTLAVAQGGGGPQNPSGEAAHLPENAVANLDVHEDLDCTLFASEPMITNPSNIDIDHRGRVWVCEIVNYRGHNGKRPEGDRILILEDTDGDAKADKETVFYQDKNFKSPHGVCVLATPDGKNTKVIVSIGDKVIVFTDENGDDKADKQEVLFSGISGTQHDHGIHAFVFGPDGKLYFNFGNSGGQLKDKDGKEIVDKAGNKINSSRQPYQEGMVFRCNLDGSDVETLGWNFRNNWEVCVDSFGTIWQSDNDDDGNRGVRINYVMEFGNYGYKDEFTGAGWGSNRTNIEQEIPLRHWHLNDPGVVPNLLQTGAGSPTGIMVYEGELLPKQFQGQVIHTDSGPSVCRAYPATADGAGYNAEIVDILVGTRNKWFRPDDACAAPDGSLFVADWYDPGVGGHAAGDLTRGRIFRVTPKGKAEKYTSPKYDFSTAAGACEALKSPNLAARYVAWTALHAMGDKAEGELAKLYGSDNPVYRARALWLLGKIEGKGQQYVDKAITDQDPNIRIVGVRLARQLPSVDELEAVGKLVGDPSPAVRRDCLIALRNNESPKVPELFAALASKHDGKDRWYLEAIGIGAGKRWDECLAAYLEKAGGADEVLKTEAGRDIVWRSRAKQTPSLLAKIIQDKATTEEQKPRYFRSFDFLKGPEKDEALKSLLGL